MPLTRLRLSCALDASIAAFQVRFKERSFESAIEGHALFNYHCLPECRNTHSSEKTSMASQNKSKNRNSNHVVFDLNAKNHSIKWNEEGNYPYPTRMGVLEYEELKHQLQIELLKVQKWAKATQPTHRGRI